MYLLKVVDPGDLRERIGIQRKTVIPRPGGGEEVTYVAWKSRWARVEWREGRQKETGEKDFGAKEYNIEDAWFYIRHLDGIDETMRIERRGQFFDILAIHDDTARRFTAILARIRK